MRKWGLARLSRWAPSHRIWWQSQLYLRTLTLGVFVPVSRPWWERHEGPEQAWGFVDLLLPALGLSLSIALTQISFCYGVSQFSALPAYSWLSKASRTQTGCGSVNKWNSALGFISQSVSSKSTNKNNFLSGQSGKLECSCLIQHLMYSACG